MIRDRIRSWLGITEIQEDQAMIHRELVAQGREQIKIGRQVSTITPGLGRVIAKLDAQFARDPQSPAMKAESDRISAEAIRRLEAEAAARAPYNHDLGDDQ